MALQGFRHLNCMFKPFSSSLWPKNGADRIKVGFVQAHRKRPLRVGHGPRRRIQDRWIEHGVLTARGWGICFPISKGNRNTARGVICKIIGWGSIGRGTITHFNWATQSFSGRRERFKTRRAHRSSLMELAAGWALVA